MGFARIVVVLWLWIAGSAALAAPATPASRPASYSFSFQDADISQVIEEILGNTLGVSYSIDPGISGKMSFRIDQRLTRPQLLQAFETALAANDVALVRDGESVVITPRAKARAVAGIRSASQPRSKAGYQVVAAPLSYAAPTEVAKAIEAMTGSGTVLFANDKLGLLILGGSGSEIDSVLETVKIFDGGAFEGAKIRWFELANAPAQTVAGEMDRLLQASGKTGISVIPLKRLNGLIAFGRTPAALDEVATWVARLDVAGKEITSSLWVYHPRNTAAEALARTLNSVIAGDAGADRTEAVSATGAVTSGATQGSSVASPVSLGEESIRIGVDKESNTLLVFAPASRWVQLQRILLEIDRAPSQLLIEASILEVTLGDDFRFGVDWSIFDGTGKFNASLVNKTSGIIGATSPGVSVTFLDNDIKAAITALGSRTAIEIVSAPKLVALNNHTARLQIGDQVPVVVQSQQGTNSSSAPLINSIDYRNTGVILNVTPRITGDDRIVLLVTQEVSSVAKTITSGIDSPTIQQRKIESTLILNDGGLVALGGLISSNTTRGNSGVPMLKDVPYLGSLFRSATNNQSRTELIVLLSAKILKDASASDKSMTDLFADMREIQSRGLLTPRP
jgi:general secretion pathway protein D